MTDQLAFSAHAQPRNIMPKAIRLLAFATTLAIPSCAFQLTDAPDEEMVIKPEKTIVAPSGTQNELKLDNIYLSRTINGVDFLTGFRIEDNGINTSTIVIENSNSQINYYSSGEIVTDFFIYANLNMAALLSGKTLSFQNGEWVVNELELPPDSTVIFSNEETIISCSLRPPLKASNTRGSCTSQNPDCHTEIPWRSIPPKVCNGEIYAIVTLPNAKEHWRISRFDGKILNRNAHKAATACLGQ